MPCADSPFPATCNSTSNMNNSASLRGHIEFKQRYNDKTALFSLAYRVHSEQERSGSIVAKRSSSELIPIFGLPLNPNSQKRS